MGLLDSFGSPDMQLALGLLAAGGAKPVRTSFGDGLLGAVQGAQAYKQAQEDRAQKAAMQQLQSQLIGSQIEETKAQAAQRTAAAEDAKRKAMEAQRIQDLLKNTFMPTTATQANAASGVTGPRPEALSAVGARPSVDYQSLIAQGVPPELVQKLAESRNYGRDKVARTVDGRDAQGRPVTFQQDEFGNTVGAPIQQWKAPVEVRRGDRVDFIDPADMSGKGSFGINQSPDAKASNAVAWARLSFDKQKDARDGAAGQLVETPSGYVRVGKDNTSHVVMSPDGKTQLAGKGGNMTEDQAKATGWLVQAENAYKNMLSAGFTADGKPKSAAYPGINDALEKIPGVGGMANALRSTDRQRFVQASSSLSEALLRAATGAGVNKDEAAQKIRELTPLFGEDEAVTQQKMASIPLYLESLKVRSGPGANKVQSMPRPQSNDGWSITPAGR